MSRTRRNTGNKRDGSSPRNIIKARDPNAEAMNQRGGGGFHRSKRQRLEDEAQERLMHDLSGLSGDEIPWSDIDDEWANDQEVLDDFEQECLDMDADMEYCVVCGAEYNECECYDTPQSI